MNHTPGPWKRLEKMIVGNLHKGERGTEGDVVCLMRGYVDYKNQDANARLIAAAPELYSTLSEITDHATKYGAAPASATKMFDRARAAIAKVEGRTA